MFGSQQNRMSATPNHALQRTAPRVTARAFCERSAIYIWALSVRSTVGHAPRHAPPSLSLRSFGDFAHLLRAMNLSPPPAVRLHAPGLVSHAPGLVSHVPIVVSHVPGPVSHVPGLVSHVPGFVSHVPGLFSHSSSEGGPLSRNSLWVSLVMPTSPNHALQRTATARHTGCSHRLRPQPPFRSRCAAPPRSLSLGSLGVASASNPAQTKTMKHIIIPTTFIAAIALLMPACDKAPTAPTTSQPDDRVKALEAEITRLKAAKPTTPKPVGELTRELATALLNKHLAEPHISQIAFKQGGLEKAKQDGLLSETGGFPPGFRFTDKGIAMAHGLANANSRVELAPFGMEQPKFNLASPVGERVTEITGIALAPVPNICEADYTTDYLIPDAAQAMYPYIFAGQRAKATFQKYDDGWRVAR